MRDGLYVAAQHPEGADPSQYLGEHLEQVGFVRDNGFDSVFAGPHFLSDPFQMLQLTPSWHAKRPAHVAASDAWPLICLTPSADSRLGPLSDPLGAYRRTHESHSWGRSVARTVGSRPETAQRRNGPPRQQL